MSTPCGLFNETYGKDSAIVRTGLQWTVLIAVLALLAVVPLLVDTYVLSLLITAALYIIAALGLNLLTGYCGQISIGHAAFVAIGAYTSALLSSRLNVPFLLCLPAAGIVAGFVGILFGAPSLRLKGFYLLMSTLAAQAIIMYAITTLKDVTGGVFGLTVPQAAIGGFVFDSSVSYSYLVIVCLVLSTFVALNLTRTKIGRNFVAVRDNDLSAEVTGVNVFSTKLTAFFIGCTFAGVSGSLWAHWATVITPDTWTLRESVWYLGYIIVGGMGSIPGTFFGVVFLVIVNQVLSVGVGALAAGSPEAAGWMLPARSIVFGLLLILFLTFEPRGLAHRWSIFKRWYRIWPFPY